MRREVGVDVGLRHLMLRARRADPVLALFAAQVAQAA